MVDAQVIDAGPGHLQGLAGEALDADPGHVEADDLPGDRLDRRRGVDLEGGGHDVAIEHHVQVLISGHPHHDLVGHRVIGIAAGVAMGDPGGQFLERRIGHQPQRRLVRHPALLQGGHPPPFQGDRVDVAGDQQIIAEHDRVAALLGGPAVRPGPPGAVAAEGRQQLPVVAGQVVLGEEVDLEGGLGDPGQPRLVGGPGFGVEVAAKAPGHVLMRHPFLGHGQMPVKQPLGHRLQLGEQVMVGMAIRHGQNSSGACRKGRQSHPAVTHEPPTDTQESRAAIHRDQACARSDEAAIGVELVRPIM